MQTWTINGIIALTAAAAGLVLFLPAVWTSRLWRATVTPLASIIGSGFLVIAPLLYHIAGGWAPLAVLAVVALACGVGSVVRFNIRTVEPCLAEAHPPRGVVALERLSDVALAVAYVISVAFYLRLLAAFLLRVAEVQDDLLSNAVASAIIAFIGLYGLLRGFRALERLEEYAVNIKLAIILGLVVGLALHDVQWWPGIGDQFALHAPQDWLHVLRLLGGVLLITQGFETSRYLGAEYDAETRIRSMRFAQLIAAVIYVVFVGLALPLLAGFDQPISETAIIDLSRAVAVVLPPLLILAAVMSQFSAGIADTIGSSGLFSEFSRGRVGARPGYLLVAGAAVTLVWSADIFEIIALASRAFALYYALQCALALAVSARVEGARRRALLRVFFSGLGLVLASIVVFAIPAETS